MLPFPPPEITAGMTDEFERDFLSVQKNRRAFGIGVPELAILAFPIFIRDLQAFHMIFEEARRFRPRKNTNVGHKHFKNLHDDIPPDKTVRVIRALLRLP